jgi:hypothetical protein
MGLDEAQGHARATYVDVRTTPLPLHYPSKRSSRTSAARRWLSSRSSPVELPEQLELVGGEPAELAAEVPQRAPPMTALADTWALTVRDLLRLWRQPWFIAITLVQPVIWLLSLEAAMT